MKTPEIYNSAQLMEYIHEIGFLPLLDSGIPGFSAEEIVDEECRYITFPDGGWDWPLWKWKGEIVTEGGCMYGKFFNKKAGFISKEWWQDFVNYRRSVHPYPTEGSIEDAILSTLKIEGSLITRELRAACGFDGPKMRSKFDSYVTKLQMGTYIVTEDFVYPEDKHGKAYGWGWSLLTTPEALYGKEQCTCERTPEESYTRLYKQLQSILPNATEKQLVKMLR